MHRNVLRLLATMLVMLGLLTLGVAPAVAQEELTVEVTFDQTTVDPRTGEVTLSGTITCSEPALVDVFGELRQQVGRIFTVRGFVGVFVECPGPEGTTFTVTVTADQGRFVPGPARLTAVVFGCVLDPVTFECTETFVEELDRAIRLAPAR
jgi:hypothetical protein